jgi:hypothetical protein
MPTWSELQAEFQNLREPLQFHRLDFQWGAAGEYYRIAGGVSSATRQFEALAEIAGEKLSELPPRVLPEAVLRPAAAYARWYEALRHCSGDFELGHCGWQTDDEGNHAGNIFTGVMNHPVEASALVALRFSALPAAVTPQIDAVPQEREILELKPSFWGIAVDLKALWQRLMSWKRGK